MKKLVTLIALLVFAIATISAQIPAATEAYNKGAEAVNAGNLEEAIGHFKEAIDVLYTEQEEMEELDEQSASLLADLESRLPGLMLQNATDYAKEGKNDEAIKKLEETIKQAEYIGDESTVEKANKILPQLYYRDAVSLYKESAFDQALAELEKALEADPEFAKGLYLEAVIYKKQGNDESLKEVALKAKEVKGNDDTIDKTIKLARDHFLKKGNKEKSDGNYEAAIKSLETSLDIDADNDLAYLLLLQSYKSTEQWEEAIKTAKKALEFPMDAEKTAGLYYELGTAYHGSGQSQEACAAYQKAAVGKYEANAKYQMEHVVKCN